MNEINEVKKSRNWIDIIEVFAKVVASIAIPLVIAISGTSINSTIKEKEIGLKYVEVAVGILKSKPTPETGELRNWAISIIQRHSTIPLSEKAIEELQVNPLPKGDFLVDESGNFIIDEKRNRIIAE